MILDRVTVTGADNSIHPKDLVDLSNRFPFVEWGILLSKSQEGSKRFPTVEWIDRLLELAALEFPAGVTLSGHLCGSWVRDLCRGGNSFSIDRPGLAHCFDRLQLNFHAEAHEINPDAFVAGLRNLEPEQGYIFQFDDVNNALMDAARLAGIQAAPLFDTSGGAGVLPGSWPKPVADYCGYAGGLSPDNLEEQLDRIAAVTPGARIWIDVETHVRSGHDAQFDLGLVERFLDRAAPRVVHRDQAVASR